ncbi:MAG: hypothetical protein KKD46_06185 [Euryarchaeota archaeon]|nr:hypothetical protein [Euryarchaeota archaeon]MBU4222291.1 hypothetical protein [Euryarchaeota archaeon]MBU4340486.1 hypothetical protein [Euryarchaeota archaeon]MCG2735421.1 hypothetical protein [Candidatus Methanoperedenaceae archaeon]
MDIHLVKRYLYAFFFEPFEHLPEYPVDDRMPVFIFVYLGFIELMG